MIKCAQPFFLSCLLYLKSGWCIGLIQPARERATQKLCVHSHMRETKIKALCDYFLLRARVVYSTKCPY